MRSSPLGGDQTTDYLHSSSSDLSPQNEDGSERISSLEYIQCISSIISWLNKIMYHLYFIIFTIG